MRNLVILLSILTVVSCSSQNSDVPVTKQVDNESWKEYVMKESQPLIIDVRTPEEFKAGHISGALNIDFRAADFQSKMEELDENRTVFIYCQSGGRSGKACDMLETLGFKDIIELKDGYSSWVP